MIGCTVTPSNSTIFGMNKVRLEIHLIPHTVEIIANAQNTQLTRQQLIEGGGIQGGDTRGTFARGERCAGEHKNGE